MISEWIVTKMIRRRTYHSLPIQPHPAPLTHSKKWPFMRHRPRPRFYYRPTCGDSSTRLGAIRRCCLSLPMPEHLLHHISISASVMFCARAYHSKLFTTSPWGFRVLYGSKHASLNLQLASSILPNLLSYKSMSRQNGWGRQLGTG